jgi:hypothetical protein
MTKKFVFIKEGIVEYCTGRLGLTAKDLEDIMALPPKSFHDYRTYYPVLSAFKFPIEIACKLNMFSPVLYEKFFG